MKQEFIDRLVEEIIRVKERISAQTKVVELAEFDRLKEEQAELRNMVMRLEGLELMLRKTREQAFGG